MEEGFTFPRRSALLDILRGYARHYRDLSRSLHEVPSLCERATVLPWFWMPGSSRTKQTLFVWLTSLFSST